LAPSATREIAGDDLSADLFRLAAAAQIHVGELEGRQAVEGLDLVAVIFVVVPGGRQLVGEDSAAILGVGGEGFHQRFRMRHRHGTQKHGVDHSEDRGVGADAKSQRSHHNQHESRIAQRGADRVFNVSKHP
jgi:hypothetical protein